MAHNIIMPKAGMAMEEGTVVRWLKKVGETISKGETIAVIETDKVTMDLEAEYEGTLLAIVHGDGEVVTATHTIAWVGAPGEKIPTGGEQPADTPQPAAATTKDTVAAPVGDHSDASAADGAVAATPAARAYAAETGIALSSVAGSGPGGAVRLRDFPQARTVKATPLARKVAELSGIDLGGLGRPASGGKIRKADVMARMGTPVPGTSIPMTGMRRIIADKMLQSHQQVPAVTLTTRVDVTELAALRERMNAASGAKVSYTDFVLRAAAVALRENPLINSVIEGESILLRAEINIGIAVALEAGLIVPVVRKADELGVRQIAAATRDLAERARTSSLSPDECTGGTFTITNLGMYGITEFTPLINVPESAILGVGAIEEAFRTGAGGGIESRKVMSLCLTHDHRSIDGAPAAAFLGRIKTLLEDCYSLVG
jgi:pyruvate dehydrogenase E2 component (dihydrolipoamide acetyltransferase)